METLGIATRWEKEFFELRIDFGPGYRIYFGQDANLIVLLGGGTKWTQAADIKRAKRRWKEYHA
jgi:putative addiction module killer protein